MQLLHRITRAVEIYMLKNSKNLMLVSNIFKIVKTTPSIAGLLWGCLGVFFVRGSATIAINIADELRLGFR